MTKYLTMRILSGALSCGAVAERFPQFIREVCCRLEMEDHDCDPSLCPIAEGGALE